MVLEGSLSDRDHVWSRYPDRWMIEQPFRILEQNSDHFFRKILFFFWVTVWNWKLNHKSLFYNTTWIVHEEMCYWPTKSLNWAGITLFDCQVELHYVKSDSSKLNKQVIYFCCITSLHSQLWLHGMSLWPVDWKKNTWPWLQSFVWYLDIILKWMATSLQPHSVGSQGWEWWRRKFPVGRTSSSAPGCSFCLRESQRYGSTLLHKK